MALIVTNNNAKNDYKIDWNIYSSKYNPFGLFGRRPGWRPWRKWEHIASFETREEAEAHHRNLIGLPIYLENK
jgi:hypothetical protein